MPIFVFDIIFDYFRKMPIFCEKSKYLVILLPHLAACDDSVIQKKPPLPQTVPKMRLIDVNDLTGPEFFRIIQRFIQCRKQRKLVCKKFCYSQCKIGLLPEKYRRRRLTKRKHKQTSTEFQNCNFVLTVKIVPRQHEKMSGLQLICFQWLLVRFLY